MFVVLRHQGKYSQYTCSVIGVYNTRELATQAIDDVLEAQIERLKQDLERYIKTDNGKRYMEQFSTTLQLLKEQKYNLDGEKELFQILDLELNKTRRYKRSSYTHLLDPERVHRKEQDDMVIDNTFEFDTDIYIRERDSSTRGGRGGFSRR